MSSALEQRVVFRNPHVFGEGFDTTFRTVIDVVGSMFASGKIDMATGLVKMGSLPELWSYVYYLYHYNKDRLDVFAAMKKGEFASAGRFYKAVQAATGTLGRPVKEKTLKAFINRLVGGGKVSIPGRVSLAKHPQTNKQRLKIEELQRQLDLAAVAKSNANVTALKIDALQNELSSCKAMAEELRLQKPAPDHQATAAYEQRINELEAKVREAAQISRVAITEPKDTADLEKLREMIKHEVNVSTDDVTELITLLKRRMDMASMGAPATNVAKKRDCSADIAAFKKRVEQTVQSVILTKMCIIKVIGTVVGATWGNASTACAFASEDSLRAQVANFKRLPQAKQKSYKDMYIQNRNEILTYRDRFAEIANSGITSCEDLDAIKAEYERSLEHLTGLVSNITNINEDLLGSVRVFVKLRRFIDGLDDRAKAKAVRIDIRNNTHVSIECEGQSASGTFFGVFDEHYTNADMYSGALNTKTDGLLVPAAIEEAKPWSLRKTFDQLQDGYSICMLTMGYSGSGKSYGFFGGKSEPGIVHYGLANLPRTGPVAVQYVFELYYDYIDILKRTLKTKVIVGYDRTKDLSDSLAKYGVTNVEHDPIELKADTAFPGSDINAFVNDNMRAITDHQRKRGRIKRTMNNDASSRSHLFVVMNVNGKSFLTVCDLAGFENAKVIYDMMFSTKKTLPYFLMQFDSDGKYNGSVRGETIGTYLKDPTVANTTHELKKGDVGELKFAKGAVPRIETSLQKNVQVIMESFFVVESLLHMCFYFNQRNGIKKTFELQRYLAGNIVYDTSRVFVKPETEDTQMGFKKQVNMIPILKFINDLGKADTVSKFILYGAIRPDKCDNIDTVKYLASVASTM